MENGKAHSDRELSNTWVVTVPLCFITSRKRAVSASPADGRAGPGQGAPPPPPQAFSKPRQFSAASASAARIPAASP